jgi:ribosomal protein L29
MKYAELTNLSRAEVVAKIKECKLKILPLNPIKSSEKRALKKNVARLLTFLKINYKN